MELTPRQRRLIDKRRRVMRAASERVIKASPIAPKKERGLIGRLIALFL